MEAIDYRGPARDAPLLLATLGVGYAVLCAAGAIMTAGTQAVRMAGRVTVELGGIREELAKVNEAIR